MTENKEESDTVTEPGTLVPVVHSTPATSGGSSALSHRAWKWTRKKRQAVKLVVKGWADTRIAAELGKHRNTIRAWRTSADFHAAVINDAREYMTRTRFKRVHETGLITDQIAGQVAKRFASIGSLNQVDLNAMQLFLREYREFRAQERVDFGDDVHRFEGSFHIGVSGMGGSVSGEKSSQSFKTFVETHAEKIPKRLIDGATTPQDALVEATRELLKGTEILNEIFDEEQLESKDGK